MCWNDLYVNNIILVYPRYVIGELPLMAYPTGTHVTIHVRCFDNHNLSVSYVFYCFFITQIYNIFIHIVNTYKTRFIDFYYKTYGRNPMFSNAKAVR